MKCNSLYRQNENKIKTLALIGAMGQLEDVSVRTSNRWKAAMYNAGLSVKTINKVNKLFKEVQKENSKTSVQEGLGDYELYSRLKGLGVEIEMPKNEI